MRHLKRFAFVLVLIVVAMLSTSVPGTAYGDGLCPGWMVYCECQGFVGCAFDCFDVCPL